LIRLKSPSDYESEKYLTWNSVCDTLSVVSGTMRQHPAINRLPDAAGYRPGQSEI
jgi:hypothetical protein